ncbi:DEAD-box ATP-dependent RNA helicase CshA [Sporotomaculum syntrophicum]|uniref:ATP-dependent RNA helicase CshA n=1 Tax=Sporotomaculum syntrophicum TaxID=182264 RepID=A0A9D2WR72_9FIRM|nr:DEAD/DEAH box helicase [Sporotomaculum syntrophicum]KAF1085879.1 DEAD-box ATP-dependent RNA helicase CshA [Sporotomaculum syntrophicum]
MAVFTDFNLTEPVIKALNNLGFEEATPIQELAIPVGLQGYDLIGQAHTGTGKTAAFGIPLMELLHVGREYIQAIVLTPTRELAVQVAEELNKLGQYKGIRTLPIYGGQDINRQIRALKKKPHIIVGTPGRLMDHMGRKTIRLNQVNMVVLDEADEMLNMGFIEDIENILKDIPEERQTMLFSATIPAPIRALAERFMNSPEVIKVESRQMTVPIIEQSYIEVQEKQKFEVLCRLLDTQAPERAIIFGRTKRRVDELFEGLNKRGYSAEGIHGDLSQARRDQVMRQFKEGTIEVLVATDVAARGLDITGVTHIYNFDIPQDPEGYVHRIGRTGRAGKAGVAITLVTPREIHHLRVIENMTRGKITRRPMPTLKDAIEGQQRIAVERLMTAVEKENIENYRALAEGLLEETDSVTLLSAALKVLTKEPDQTPVALTEEVPIKMKKNKNLHAGQRGYYGVPNRKKNNTGAGDGFRRKKRSSSRSF